ncbi:DEAD-box type RNA helicase [Phlyctochytrium planicorne]|nr:DEAD-box type RNA helicase [Phlyctochytrium planicorne]
MSLLQSLRALSKSKTFQGLGEWHANQMGYRKLGLRFDDLIPDETEVVQEAIRRLPPREFQDRIFRFRRALNLSVAQSKLEQPEWTKPEELFASEILRHPACLQSSSLDNMFVQVLLSIQSKKPLRLKTGVLPGLVILSIHNEPVVRKWALKCLTSSRTYFPTGEEELLQIKDEIIVIANSLFEMAGNHSTYNITQDAEFQWRGLACVISSLSEDGISAFLWQFKEIVDSIFFELKRSHGIAFWLALQCFTKIAIAKHSSKPFGLNGSYLVENLLASKEFLVSSVESVQFKYVDEDDDITSFCFKWILPLIDEFDSVFEQGVFFGTFKSFAMGLCDELKQSFITDVSLPLLQRATNADRKLLLEPAVVLNLSICSATANPALTVTQKILDLLEADFGKIENFYESHYRGRGPTTLDPVEIMTKVWVALQNEASLPENIRIGIARNFSRIYLLDFIDMSDEKVADEISGFNNSLRLVLDVTLRIFKKSFGKNHVAIQSTSLYLILSPHDDLSRCGKDLLLNIVSTKYVEMMLFELNNIRNTITDALKHLASVDDDFWMHHYNLLDSFRDYCTLGPPLLKSAIKFLEILMAIFESLFVDPSLEFEKETAWLKVWPFIIAVLNSSVNWAKQDIKLKNSVTETIQNTLKLSGAVLNHVQAFPPTARFLSSLSAPLSKIISAGIKWFRVHSEILRNDTVALVSKIMETATTKVLKLDNCALEALGNVISGSTKSHLSSSQKHSFELLLQSYIKLSHAQKVAKLAPKAEIRPLKPPSIFAERATLISANVQTQQKIKTVDSKQSLLLSRNQPVNARPSEVPEKTERKIPPPPKAVTREFPKRDLRPVLNKFKPVSAPKTKKGKGGNLIALLRQEHSQNVRQNARFQKSAAPRVLSSDDESGPVTLKVIAADLSPNRPKRSIKVLDENNNVIDPTSKKRNIGIGEVKVAEFVRTLDDLRRFVLSFDFNDSGDLPKDFSDKDIQKIPASFSSMKQYIEIFEPFAKLEAWENFKSTKEEVDLTQKFVAMVVTIMQVDDFFDVKFGLSSDIARRYRVSENDVLYLEPETSRTNVPPFIGEARAVTSKREETSITVRFYLKGRQQHRHMFHVDTKWLILRLFSLTTTIREYDALISLNKLPLKDDILNPLLHDIPQDLSVDPEKVRKMQRLFNLNEFQAEAIHRAKEQQKGFVLIQGPPGTALVGLLLSSAGRSIAIPGSQFAQKKANKMMLCAPSNAACDELILRLRLGVHSIHGEKMSPKIIRLGSLDSIKEEVQEFSFDHQVNLRLKNDKGFERLSSQSSPDAWDALLKKQDSLKDERETLRKKEAEVKDNAAESVRVDHQISQITQRLKELNDKIKAFKLKKSETSVAMDKYKLSLKLKILDEADIVVSTLSGAGHDILTSRKDFEFSTVIIDEAGQAVETSTLIPLKYKVKKCILVGDPNQLPPTVLSSKNIHYGYEQSLFQRLMTIQPEKVMMLSVQYRMNPEISVFPSYQFYDSKLQDSETTVAECRAEWHADPLFPPYAFFNVEWGREQRGKGHSLFNPDEITVCYNLVCMLCAKFPDLKFRSKIGIITPYKLQMLKLRDKFRNRFGEEGLKCLEINTVDAFQGQEKDIIIVSTVRAGLGRAIGFLKDRRRMNVALTRAKKSMFVVGRSTSLCNNDDWRALVENAESRSCFIEAEREGFGKEVSAVPSNLLQ